MYVLVYEVLSPAGAEAAAQYKELTRQTITAAGKAATKGCSVEETNFAIIHALSDPKPRSHYIVGRMVRVLSPKCLKMDVLITHFLQPYGIVCPMHAGQNNDPVAQVAGVPGVRLGV